VVNNLGSMNVGPTFVGCIPVNLVEANCGMPAGRGVGTRSEPGAPATWTSPSVDAAGVGIGGGRSAAAWFGLPTPLTRRNRATYAAFDVGNEPELELVDGAVPRSAASEGVVMFATALPAA
jgi:hypothetical protein